MIEKKSYCDKAEYLPPFAIQCRTRVSVVEDGNELAASFHRMVLHPDSDTSGCEPNIQAMAAAVFTDQVKADWADKLAADAADMNVDGASDAETPTEA
jgi:hypothetical protein